ncbi:peptidyl-tRNA hydrolase [Blochmannia endosymbiont of Polyrhachis (Hedomyrma) turneri]|nr:peptidyl-tRNA hydrolase [Blochmannia endosymbiont of Polyrhachis (Hedomyrma) turneri]
MIKLIVGLANFSSEYFNTRHNIGAWYVEKLMMLYNGQCSLKKENRFYGYTAKIVLCDFDVRLLIPTTYMNMSGMSVLSIAKFYQLSCDEILVAHDELDLLPGRAQLKFSGGYNGHNGIKDIIKKLDNQNFYRLRIGIGRPLRKNSITRFVLSEPSLQEKKKIDELLIKVVNCTEMILIKNISGFVQCLNKC